MTTATESAKHIIRQRKGIIRTAEALKAGIHPRTLYALRDQGVLEQFSRGVYRLNELPPIAEPDLMTIAVRAPHSVICLVSALSFHGITTQVPHEVSMAVIKGSRSPRIDYPPTTIYHFSESSFTAGAEEHEIDGTTIRVYSPEKTIADCFKFRNALGMDVVLEAIKLYKQRWPFKVDALLEYAVICRVKKIMRPYLEVMI
jgi:predicted transcriptional regulator of viral defense system